LLPINRNKNQEWHRPILTRSYDSWNGDEYIFFPGSFIWRDLFGSAGSRSRSFKRKDLFENDIVFVPHNNTYSDTHYTLLVLYLKKHRVEYFDSPGGADGERIMERFLNMLDEYAEVPIVKANYDLGTIVNWENINHQKNTPQQMHSDCGVFTAITAMHLAFGILVNKRTFDESEMANFRERMAVDLLKEELSFSFKQNKY